jgi:uncharacterized protein YkwD
MARKLLPVVAALAVAALAPASAAAAIGVQAGKAVASPARASASSLIAPTSACPGQDRLDAPAAGQEQAMRCMTDFARAQAGLGSLAPVAALDQSASDKAADILRCDSFSHFACGREFTYWMRETGYMSAPCWRVGENLAWGTDELGSVRSVFEAWMRSPGHRANILGDFTEIGIDVRSGALEGRTSTRVWAQHFGSHCE